MCCPIFLKRDAAEMATNEDIQRRRCFLVVKNGRIVYEKYRDGHGVTSTLQGYSTTKSSCAALFGIAVQQGWADVVCLFFHQK